MRAVLLLALVAVAAVSVAAQSSTGGAGPAQSTATICDRVVTRNGFNNRDFSQEVAAVTALIGYAASGNASATPVVTGLFTNSITRPYFNGQVNYRANGPTPQPFASQTPGFSPDFTTDTTRTATLVDHLVRFFGSAGALGCTAPNFPVYSSTVTGFGAFNQNQVHANMNVTQLVFTTFNNIVVGAAAKFQATPAEQAIVQGVLASFGRNNQNRANMICTDRLCDCAPGLTGANCDQAAPASVASVSFVTLAFAALLAIFAMRR